MDKKRWACVGGAGVLVASAVALGLLDGKEEVWRAFQVVVGFLVGVM